MRIHSITVVFLLLVDVHLNNGKNCMQNKVYMSNERHWGLLLLPPRFFIRFCHLIVLPLYFVSFRSSLIMTPDKFQFQRQVSLSQIKEIIPIRLKFNLYGVFIEWVCRITLLFVGRLYIVNYRNFLSKIFDTSTKLWSQKLRDTINERCL